MSVQALYQQKRMSATDAIRVVKNGDTIVVPTAVGEPPSLLTALSDVDHRGDGQFVLPRRSDLAHQDQVEGGAEHLCDLCGDRHPAPHEANLFDLQAKYAEVISEAEAVAHLATL